MALAPAATVFLFILAIIVLVTLLKTLYTVRTSQAGVVERFGKFNRIVRPGLHVLVPYAERVFFVDLQVQQAQFSVETKTRDNVFVQIPVSVQYQILDANIYDAFYRLSSPKKQIESFVFNSILGHVPKLTLDETFEQQSGISVAVKVELDQIMSGFGSDRAGDGHCSRREGEGRDERHQRGAEVAGGRHGARRGRQDSEGKAGGGGGRIEGAAGQGDRGGTAGYYRRTSLVDRALS